MEVTVSMESLNANAEEMQRLRDEITALAAHVEEARPMVEAHLQHVAMSDFVPECRNAAGKAQAWLARSPGSTSLARRDAQMKAEALAEATAACEQVAEGQKKMALMHVEVADDGDEYVGERGIPYSNKALGATHCADDIGRMLNKLRQAEDDS